MKVEQVPHAYVPAGSQHGEEGEHALLEAVLRSNLLLVFKFDATDFTMRYVSPNVASLLGYDPEEVLDRPEFLVDALHPEEREAVLARLAGDGDSRASQGELELRVRHRDRSYRWFRTTVTMEPEEGGTLIAGYAVDITERRRAEDALREAEERYRSLVERIPAIVYMADFGQDGAWRYVSPRIREVLGFSPEEWAADPTRWYEQIHPDDRERAMADDRKACAEGTPLLSEYRMLTSDGRVVFIRDEAEVVLDETGRPASLRGVMYDITDRRDAEDALRASEAKLRALLSSITDVILVLDRDGRYVQIAPTNQTLLAGSPEELLGRTLHEVFPKEQADRFLHAIHSALDERQTVFLEYSLPISGAEVWFSATVSPMLEDSVVWVARDVTGQKRAEQTVRESEERYRLVIQTSPDMIAVHQGSKIVFVNAAGARMLGAASPDELVGLPVLDFVHPDFRDVVGARVRRMLEEGVPAPLLHERFIRLDGSEIDVEVAATSITFEGEQAVLVVVRDITERTRIERALVEAEAKYRTLVEQLPAVVYIGEYGEQGDWLYISPQVERVLGYTPEEWLAHPHPMASFTHPDDLATFRTEEEHSRRTGEGLSAEVRMRTREGRWVWILHEAAAVRDRSGDPFLLQGLMYDVSERKRVEHQLRASEDLIHKLFGRLVQAQEEERARIASDIHDDSIQVVTAVGLRLRTLRGTLTDETSIEATRKLEETVGAAIARMRHLLFELRPRTLDEDGLASTLRLYLDQMTDETGIDYSIENHLVEEPPAETRIAMYRIAQEALMNVRKHADASRVQVQLEPRDGGFFARVRDDGRGFAVGGEGRPGHLGLSAMRERCEMAGGWCRINSAHGAGTTVEFWLPTGG